MVTFYGSEKCKRGRDDIRGEGAIKKGSEKFSVRATCGRGRSEKMEVVFHFRSEINRLKFQKMPERYLPVCGGFCCLGAAFAGDPDSCCANKLIRANPVHFARKDYKVYFFADEESKRHFLMYARDKSEECVKNWKGHLEKSGVPCLGGYHSGNYGPFGKVDGYLEHI